MITKDDLNRVDSCGMYKIYDKWPILAKEAFESKIEPFVTTEFDNIVFAGMGGSGAIGDVFSSILSKSKIHVNVVKGYHLPSTVNANTLIIAISVSGNTIETISILKSAFALNCKIIVFSSGGKIIEFCKKHKIQFRILPQLHSPRASFASYLYSILNVLHFSFGIKKEDILDSILVLENLHKKINSSNLTMTNPSLELSKWISDVPLIYYPFGLQSSAIRFKNSLNENAKMHVFTDDVIEACHNGIVAWENHSDLKPILIQGPDDHIKTKERWTILENFFQENKIDYMKIISINGNILSKLIYLIYLLDYSAIYNGILNGIDPSPVNTIEYIKSKLN